jgi:hypothetical protein
MSTELPSGESPYEFGDTAIGALLRVGIAENSVGETSFGANFRPTARSGFTATGNSLPTAETAAATARNRAGVQVLPDVNDDGYSVQIGSNAAIAEHTFKAAQALVATRSEAQKSLLTERGGGESVPALPRESAGKLSKSRTTALKEGLGPSLSFINHDKDAACSAIFIADPAMSTELASDESSYKFGDTAIGALLRVEIAENSVGETSFGANFRPTARSGLTATGGSSSAEHDASVDITTTLTVAPDESAAADRRSSAAADDLNLTVLERRGAEIGSAETVKLRERKAKIKPRTKMKVASKGSSNKAPKLQLLDNADGSFSI